MRRGLGAWMAVALVALTASSGHATTASVLGIGPRTRAFAGAGLSQPLGYEAAFLNPAELAEDDELSFSLGYDVAAAWLYAQREGDPELRFPAPALASTSLGFTLPMPVFGRPLVLGFAGVSAGGAVADAHLPLAEQPQFPLLLTRRQAVDFAVGLGLRPWRLLALGVGVRALSSLSGSAAVEQGKTTSFVRVEDQLAPVLAPSVGATLFWGLGNALGLSARGPLRADFDIQLQAVDLSSTALPPLHLAGVAHYDPLTVGLEYSRTSHALTGLFGVTHQRFSATPPQLPATITCPATRSDCAALRASAPGFHDTFDFHVGGALRWSLTRRALATLRAGYAFVPSPVPEQTGSENLLDATRHRLGLGYGLRLQEPLPPLDVDLGVALDQLVQRTHHKTGEVDADNPGVPRLTTRGRLLSACLALTVRL